MAIQNLTFINGAYVPRTSGASTTHTETLVSTPLLTYNNLSDVEDVEEAVANLGIDPSDAVWNANKIAGTLVDYSDKDDAKVLSYNAEEEKIVWLTPAVSGALTSTTLTNADDGSTLSTIYDVYFVTLSYPSFTVILPDVEEMLNRELTFITTTAAYESWFTINGPIRDGSSFTLAGYSTVKLLSDGTNWWVTGSYS